MEKKNKKVGFLKKAVIVETKNSYALALVKYNDGGQSELKYKLHVCEENTGYSVDEGLIFKPSEQKKLTAYLTDCLLVLSDQEVKKAIADIKQQIKENTAPEMNLMIKHSITDIYIHVCEWVASPENANAVHKIGDGCYYILPDRLREVIKEFCDKDRSKELYNFLAANDLYKHDAGRNTLHVNPSKQLGISKQARYVAFYNFYEMKENIA